ncbi:MAG: hypothetical protein ACW977_10160 [Candidatus Thorarchaeota archaeon]
MSGVRRIVISIFLVSVLLAGQATVVGAAYVTLYDATYTTLPLPDIHTIHQAGLRIQLFLMVLHLDLWNCSN